ncbi:hypothetical protein PHYPSEUDO_009253 [Phytophthora pseudosyringae]|uniref:HTH myb-type domain-containing protein n=1 Tax=Phytophthora pseudosyringae TaxID=221518 RepID=A0A8T1VD07_9STRA|nr:hypothetical protein PHYPSEUDO_009253 [Phytophthora pseudosyringae]
MASTTSEIAEQSSSSSTAHKDTGVPGHSLPSTQQEHSPTETGTGMTITHSVQQEFLDDETKNLICIPCYSSSTSAHSSPMAAGSAVHTRVSAVVHQPLPTTTSATLLQVSLPGSPLSHSPVRTAESTKGERWTVDEHERFLIGMELFKVGPWKKIANVVGTRDARQTMSHAQKYRQKIKRRKLEPPTPEPPHRADHGPCATSSGGVGPSTKRMRIAPATAAAASEADVVRRVVADTGTQHVSPRVQSRREALGGMISGLERATGLIPAATLLEGGPAARAITDARARDGVMATADTRRVDRPNQRLDTTLEPLDINDDVSVVHESWLGPDELWDFLEGRPAVGADVAGACAVADAEPRLRDASNQ